MTGTVSVLMPKLGDTVLDGTVEEWLVAVGDVVDEGTSLLTITTDKVTTEYPSEVAGRVVELLAEPGQTLEVGAPIARIEIDDDRPDEPDSPSRAAAKAPARDDAVSRVTDGAIAAPARPAETSRLRDPNTAIVSRDRLRPTGSARAAAAQQGLNPAMLDGSGRGGRVRLADVAVARRAEDRPRPVRRPSHATMRNAIAAHMTQSWRTNRHATVIAVADCAAIVEVRRRERAAFEERTGARLTMLPFVVDAIGRAFGTPTGIGVAVELQPDGLVVPVVRSAGAGWATVAEELDQLVTAAREGTLSADQTSGAVTTVTNVGTWGVQVSQPILNAGQATIVGVGAASSAPTVAEGGIGWRVGMPLSLCYDRNRLDEFAAADLLDELVAAIELPPR